MKKTNKTVIVFLIVMFLLSFTNLLNIKIDGEVLKLSGISVIVGVVAYFVTRKTNKNKDEGLNIKTIFKDFKDHPKAIIYAILPFVTCILSTVIANKFLPEFNEHVNNRASFAISEDLMKTILMIAVLTLGEEIAWRGFFQKQIDKKMHYILSIIITSLLFAIGHYSAGTFAVVAYDLLFVFIDSSIFGLIFKETDNAWCSWIPHFLADILGILLIV
ncbi:MAG: CPBP family intramembrane metalloprotease [Bacilli bacterium]|nr:CPBP family intramembrane metalloprotease [Bacilli bacterium]MBQ3298557.1 CPBP family intramembrane metalloprotease [Bacilli bacterium]MBQ6404694.1 CPBP family intramembrane metalloprotease [Bacilli bacterium]